MTRVPSLFPKVTIPFYQSAYALRRCYATAAESSLRTALFFPGHGVQRVGMTSAWLEAYPSTVRPFLEETDEILKYPLSKVIAEGPVNKLNETENAQPGIMATSIMILRVLEKEYGFRTDEKIDVTLGHSLGEYAALVVAGYLDYPFALQMVRRRAEIMAECTRQATNCHYSPVPHTWSWLQDRFSRSTSD